MHDMLRTGAWTPREQNEMLALWGAGSDGDSASIIWKLGHNESNYHGDTIDRWGSYMVGRDHGDSFACLKR
jgi:hypothetical protein